MGVRSSQVEVGGGGLVGKGVAYVVAGKFENPRLRRLGQSPSGTCCGEENVSASWCLIVCVNQNPRDSSGMGWVTGYIMLMGPVFFPSISYVQFASLSG